MRKHLHGAELARETKRALTEQGWSKGAFWNGGKLCVRGGARWAAAGHCRWAEVRGDGVRSSTEFLADQELCELIAPVIVAEFPDRLPWVGAKGFSTMTLVAEWNDNGLTTLDDVFLVLDKAAARENTDA